MNPRRKCLTTEFSENDVSEYLLFLHPAERSSRQVHELKSHEYARCYRLDEDTQKPRRSQGEGSPAQKEVTPACAAERVQRSLRGWRRFRNRYLAKSVQFVLGAKRVLYTPYSVPKCLQHSQKSRRVFLGPEGCTKTTPPCLWA